TARLRGDAERQTAALRNRDGLDRFAVLKSEEKLLGAVGGALASRDLEARELELVRELIAQPRRKLGHRLKRRRWIHPQSTEYLPGAIRRLSRARHELAQPLGRRCRRELEQVDLGRDVRHGITRLKRI